MATDDVTSYRLDEAHRRIDKIEARMDADVAERRKTAFAFVMLLAAQVLSVIVPLVLRK